MKLKAANIKAANKDKVSIEISVNFKAFIVVKFCLFDNDKKNRLSGLKII